MYKLTVVAGPNRGSSYAVQEGETSIGRQTGNGIILSSSKVSKRHCTLVVNQGEIVLNDLGSANGTFVNGTLSPASRPIKAGDRISIGEFVLELVKSRREKVGAALPVQGLGNIIPFPMLRGNAEFAVRPPAVNSSGDSMLEQQSISSEDAPPRDLKGKALWYFEKFVMPFFYNLLLKSEWRMIGIGLFIVFILCNLVISVYPILESGRQTVVRETGMRAHFMAKQIVEKNTAALASNAETKTEIGSIEREDGVRIALLTALDNRILAPGSMLNQYLLAGNEAKFAVRAADAFKKGRETGMVKETDDSTIVAIEPLKILNPQLGKNVVVAMAIVSIDTTLSNPDLGEMGMVYSETLIMTGLLAAVILMILYRLTIKPFQVLNDDMDKVLKSTMAQVTHEFKWEELNPLWDLINSTLQRVPKGDDANGLDGLGGNAGPSIEEYIGPLRMMSEISGSGLVVLDADKKIAYINPLFEQISGVRSDNSIGQDLSAVARDQAFIAVTHDLMDRIQPGADGTSEEFEFNGINYKMHAMAFGGSVPGARCYVLLAQKAEG